MFDMLEFVLLYHGPLDALTSLQEMKLRACELSKGEWKIAEQLSDVLKVSCSKLSCSSALTLHTDFQTSNPFLLC
jgi:predicted  nucleic acid-binding Zn ribbon protein